VNIILVVFDSLRKDCIGAYGSPYWGPVETPHFDALARESLRMTRAYPESLPTLPARRALYTGRRVYPFHGADFRLKGDFLGAPGWGPIPEDQPTLAEVLREHGYRTALIADVYHMFKPSKNFWRGFDQWTFLRGQEKDPCRSGPRLSQDELDRWLPRPLQDPKRVEFLQQCAMNIHDRTREEDFFAARVLTEAARWLEQNRDADRFFLTVESFDPHEPWFVPSQYRRLYDPGDGPEQVLSGYRGADYLAPDLLARTQANYSGLVTFCDRWFGHFLETCRTLGRLRDSVLLFTTDHGHSIGDYEYVGKRGYPSRPEVLDVPLLVRHPEGRGAGRTSDLYVQHTDMAAQVLEFAGVPVPADLDGRPFYEAALAGGPPIRDHVTIAWDTAVTVIRGRWWLNGRINGKGVFLHDLEAAEPFARNLADRHPDVAEELHALAVADAAGGFPDWLMARADAGASAPGCSDLAARK
jgi:arylsulfatase A-like enzyme